MKERATLCCSDDSAGWRPLNCGQRRARLIVGVALLSLALSIPWSPAGWIAVSLRRGPPFQNREKSEAAQLSRLYERGKLHSMGRMTLITGGERRRRWRNEDRTRILAAIAEPGAVVADVARREDVCTSLVYKWRRAAQREASAAVCGFSPVIIEPAPRVATSQEQPPQEAAAGVVEVELKDVRVKISATAPSSVIAATLKALRS